MKKLFVKTFVTLNLIANSVFAQSALPTQPLTASAQPIYLEGYIPLGTMPLKKGGATLQKVFLIIENGLIKKVSAIRIDENLIPSNSLRLTENITGPMLLSPGFIDMHNHIEYNVLPLWDHANGQFNSRFKWRKDESYQIAVKAPIKKIEEISPKIETLTEKKQKVSRFSDTSAFCRSLQYAEMKALAGGVTSIHGVGARDNSPCVFQKLIRNIESNEDFDVETKTRTSFELFGPTHGLLFEEAVFPALLGTLKNGDSIPQQTLNAYANLAPDIKEQDRFKYTDTFFSGYMSLVDFFKSFIGPEKKVQRGLITHLSEGKSNDPFTRVEFRLANALGLAKNGMIMIHGIGLNEHDWQKAATESISLVWSPLSNLLLYGETTNVVAAKKAGINISFGSDWSPSGSKNLLDEVKVAKSFFAANNIKDFSDKDLFEMMTINAAKALKLDSVMGSIAENKLADIVAFPLDKADLRKNPYSKIVNSDSSDIKMVILDGAVVLSQGKIIQATQPNAVTEKIISHNSDIKCARAFDQVFVNLGFSIYSTIDQINSEMRIQKDYTNFTVDDFLSCRDQKYWQKINATLSFANKKPLTSIELNIDQSESKFEELNKQLDQIISNSN